MATMMNPPKIVPAPPEIVLDRLGAADAWGPEMEKVVHLAADLASEFLAVMELTHSVKHLLSRDLLRRLPPKVVWNPACSRGQGRLHPAIVFPRNQ